MQITSTTVCFKCGQPLGGHVILSTDPGTGSLQSFHQHCAPIVFHGPAFGPSPKESRNAAIEEAAEVCDRAAVQYRAMKEGEAVADAECEEMAYCSELNAKAIRRLKL